MWCKRCRFGGYTYKAQYCGQCFCNELTDENPFAEAQKKPRSIRAMWKRTKMDNVKKDAKKQMNEEIADITQGKQSRDYTQMQ